MEKQLGLPSFLGGLMSRGFEKPVLVEHPETAEHAKRALREKLGRMRKARSRAGRHTAERGMEEVATQQGANAAETRQLQRRFRRANKKPGGGKVYMNFDDNM